MTETEQVNVRLSIKTLARVDELVEEGMYTNRQDLMKDAVRRLLFPGGNEEIGAPVDVGRKNDDGSIHSGEAD